MVHAHQHCDNAGWVSVCTWNIGMWYAGGCIDVDR